MMAKGFYRVECAFFVPYPSASVRSEAEALQRIKPLQVLKKSLGFTQEGVFRSSIWADGNPYSKVVVRYLRPEWEKFLREVQIHARADNHSSDHYSSG
jgi:hypothetical protein